MSAEKRNMGAKITPLPNAAPLVGWLLENASLTDGLKKEIEERNFQWAVLQCTDSLVWGVYEQGKWVWASSVVSEVREPKMTTLLEARFFGSEAEVLVWRSGDDPCFVGRILEDSSEEINTLNAEQRPFCQYAEFQPPEDRWIPPSEYEKPAEERMKPEESPYRLHATSSPLFIDRQMPDGRITVTPLGKGLILKEYLSENEYGGLRISATRFMEVQ